MAKRFTDTSKYKKPFFRGLPGAYKLFYDFLYHDCDHAGIWIVDIEIAQNYVGNDMPINPTKALELFNSEEVRVIPFDNGKKWFIPLFISFQYGQLSENNRAHGSVVQILKKFKLIDENLTPIDYIPKPLTSPLQGDKDKDMDKDMEMDKEKETGNGKRTSFGKSENLFETSPPDPDNSIIGQMWGIWKTTFPKYTADKENDYEGLGRIFRFMCRQTNLHSRDPADTQFQITFLNTFQVLADEVSKEGFWTNKPLKSIANNIQEFYNKIKNPIDAKASKSANGKAGGATRDELSRLHAERFGKGR